MKVCGTSFLSDIHQDIQSDHHVGNHLLDSSIDIDILRLSSTETRGKYVFDLHGVYKRPNKKSRRKSMTRDDVNTKCEAGRKALIFARQQLLDEVAKKDCNVLLLEG